MTIASEDAVALTRDRLIRVNDARALGVDPRDLRRAFARGLLVRVRRGVYCPIGMWEEVDGRGRHLLAIRAAVAEATPPFLVAGRSAGAIWGLPFSAEWPDDVILLAPDLGGGKSEPGVRRTTVSVAAATPFEVDGIPMTTLARTALDMARTESFVRAVAIVDRALWRRNPRATSPAALDLELSAACYVRGAAHVGRVVNFASALSDSDYESMCRALIHELGFVAPQLQREFVDAEGSIFPDFYWESVRKAGEFDGKVKYTRDEYTRGDPSEVLWREKRREDRLRRQVDGVVRIHAEHVHDPSKLASLLKEAGIPRQ